MHGTRMSGMEPLSACADFHHHPSPATRPPSQQMEELVRQMSSKRGFPKDVRAFTAVIRAYGRAGLWKEALELVTTMKVGVSARETHACLTEGIGRFGGPDSDMHAPCQGPVFTATLLLPWPAHHSHTYKRPAA